jgi:hypothetical protein
LAEEETMSGDIPYQYFIRSGWGVRTETPTDIGLKFLKALDALSRIDPIFENWQIFELRNRSSLSLDAARSRIAQIIENDVTRNDFGEPTPIYGYPVVARAGVFRDPHSVTFRVRAGGRHENGTKLEFGGYGVAPDLAIITYPLFMAALLAINAIWRAPWACAQAFRSNTVKVPIHDGRGYGLGPAPMIPSAPTFPYSIFHAPWFAYLSATLAEGLELPPEIETKKIVDGGLLMIATEERLDPDITEHARRARILAETLIARTGQSTT